MNDSANNLTAADVEMFRRIGVDKNLLLLSRVRRVTDAEACAILARNPDPLRDMQGIEFPYIAPGNGHRVASRIRRDHPDREDSKISGKYRASAHDRRHLYFPPGLTDADNIILVEAEKSALAITAWARRTGARYQTVAMGGCWGWLGK